MKIKQLLIVTFFSIICANTSFAQNQLSASDIADKYVKELNLKDGLAKDFKNIVLNYAPQFKTENMRALDYNAVMKKETLEIYKILDQVQFTQYKKLRESIEPNKKYRVETN